LTRYLKAKDPIVVRAALRDLATRGPKAKPTVPTIRELLKHRDASVRIDAAWTLIDLKEGPGEALETILGATQAKESPVRAYAAKALGEIVNPPFVICCWGPGPRHMTPRPAMSRQAEPILMGLLKDKEARVRLAAAEALVRIGKEAKVVVPTLTDALRDADPRVRFEAETLLRRVDKDAAEKAGLK
jgi:HEAT repeat protein